MVSLVVVFWMYVILFAIIGAMRGWAREMLVSFAVILALFILTVLDRFAPFANALRGSPQLWFWVRTGILLALVFFGYQTPSIQKLAGGNRFARERLQDILLGVFLGALNGYLIAGSIWYFMDNGGYPFPNIVSGPTTAEVAETTARLMDIMPPVLLGGSSAIYFAVALAFAFVLIVFI